jgi:hypothetical protein
MITIEGTVIHKELEGGLWVIDTGEEIFQLMAGPEEIYEDGKEVRLRGQIREDLVSFGMMGPIFQVIEVEST